MHAPPKYIMEMTRLSNCTKVWLFWQGGQDEMPSLEVVTDVNDIELENAIFGWAHMTFDFDGQYKYNYTFKYDLEKMTLHESGTEEVLRDDDWASYYEGTWRD